MVRIKVGDKRTYTVPLRKEWLKVPRWRRSKRAVDALHSYLEKHTKTENVKISNWLNQAIWKDGGKNPPAKVEIEVKIENRKVQDKKTKKEIDVPFAVAELATLPKRAERLTKKKEERNKKLKLDAKPKTESVPQITGKDPKELAKSLKEKLTAKKKESPAEKKKSAKDLAAELHAAEEKLKEDAKKQAKPTKGQEANMHK
jgi:large subunit ribosomal protein L31e